MLLRKAGTAMAILRSYWRGWRTDRKIVVIESDDWGCIRTSSPEAYDRLAAAGYPMDRSPFARDGLETSEDLQALFDVLEGVRDARGRPACLAANMILANPDFDRIRRAGFREYFYEPVAVTAARTPERQDVPRLWREGLDRRVFIPQLHAREHIRWWDWLRDLRNGSREALELFDLGMCGVPLDASREGRNYFASPYGDDADLTANGVDPAAMVLDGARLFREQFGYSSLSVIAPKYQWTDSVERAWRDAGVRYIQGGVVQGLGEPGRRRFHFLGERSPTGCWYLVRNCVFEPALGGRDWVAGCLRQVRRAFRCRKPAILSSHRLNYIGAIRLENRRGGLGRLRELLAAICATWPDVLFLSSVEVGMMIESGTQDLEQLRHVTPAGLEIPTRE